MSQSSPELIIVRGYVKQVGPSEFVGVCLTLNLVVQAASLREARDKLSDLIEAYLQDAADDNEFSKWVPRHAPFQFYREWFLCRGLALIHRMRHRPFECFKTGLLRAHA